ncbi:MAG: amidohydrolase [Gammaproteobacteria bacterium]|nr:amidohydrolase [Gammaproteobacteria bacterium]
MALDVTGKYRYPDPKPEWLALHREPVLDPALPIVDAHHHLWQEPGKEYFADDLVADLATGHNIVATVFLQCHFGYSEQRPEHLRPVGETEKVEAIRLGLQKRCPRFGACAGIVSFADLLAPHLLNEVLDAHLAASPRHFRGVRQSVARDSHFPDGIVIRPAPAGMLADPGFRQSMKILGRRGLTYDAMLYHEQIPEITALARAVPDVQIVVDHIGCPIGVGPYEGRARDTFDVWRSSVEQLAACPNVSMKFGGFGMIIMGANYHLQDRPPASARLADAWRPYFKVIVDHFGCERCLFESNFPVDKAMFSYPVLWNAFKRLTVDASSQERADLFSRTAAKLYRLSID